jgi:RNA polymerase sigma-70 factor (ECF subfamily)
MDRVVERMPEKRKEVFLLSRRDGKSNDDIARELGISKKTVENHLNAALRELRKITSCLAVFL